MVSLRQALTLVSGLPIQREWTFAFNMEKNGKMQVHVTFMLTYYCMPCVVRARYVNVFSCYNNVKLTYVCDDDFVTQNKIIDNNIEHARK